ncbi:hypothetical protein HK096_003758, partial [Nowakowskiella sp. JEL0078]
QITANKQIVPIIHDISPTPDKSMSLTGVSFTDDLHCFFGPIPSPNTKFVSSTSILVEIPMITLTEMLEIRRLASNMAMNSDKRAQLLSCTSSHSVFEMDNSGFVHMPILLVRSNKIVFRTGFYHRFK